MFFLVSFLFIKVPVFSWEWSLIQRSFESSNDKDNVTRKENKSDSINEKTTLIAILLAHNSQALARNICSAGRKITIALLQRFI